MLRRSSRLTPAIEAAWQRLTRHELGRPGYWWMDNEVRLYVEEGRAFGHAPMDEATFLKLFEEEFANIASAWRRKAS